MVLERMYYGATLVVAVRAYYFWIKPEFNFHAM
jgi:hypothetical protein